MGSVEFAEPLGSELDRFRQVVDHAKPERLDQLRQDGAHTRRLFPMNPRLNGPLPPLRCRAHKLEIAIANSGGLQSEAAPVNYFLEANPRMYLTNELICSFERFLNGGMAFLPSEITVAISVSESF